MTTKERKKRADTIREIRRMVKLLVNQSERDKSIAEHRKKTIKLVVNKKIYNKYMINYIKKPGTPEKPIWEIFSDYFDT